MRNKKILIIFIAFLILVVVAILLFFLFKQNTSLLSEEEMLEMVQKQYEGSTIESVHQQGTLYTIVLQHTLGQYQLLIDGETGDTISLKRLSLHQDEDSQNQDTGGNTEDPIDDHAKTKLTEQEAIEIALSEVQGRIDQIVLEEEDGITVYEVEIEVDNETEATIIINAYTGKVLFITWD